MEFSPPYQSPFSVAPGIWCLSVPIPIPLKYVNCFLIAGPTGWTLVDAGFNDEGARAAWQQCFTELAIRPQDVAQILVTHYHPDHLGAAGWLQEWTGAPAFMHEREIPLVELFWGLSMEAQAEGLTEFFLGEGMDPETARSIGEHHKYQSGTVQPMAKLQPLPTGSSFTMGGRPWEVLWTPGHSDGLAVFWDASTGTLLANDMLLAKITPNVSLWPKCRPNPLQDYLDSLARVEALQAKLALTGHRTMIEDVSGRAAEIRGHHGERLAKTLALVGDGATGWAVCQRLFPIQQLSIHQVRFAMSEALAHLVYLVGEGHLVKEGTLFRPA
ncbi:MAG TPA: MBL fold metallo-hydrolase [Symbiobacteriaceae bacterium]|nr:MBL fold metallo-hydrolase [Symbiobacteriaceae bacterium]